MPWPVGVFYRLRSRWALGVRGPLNFALVVRLVMLIDASLVARSARTTVVTVVTVGHDYDLALKELKTAIK